MYRQNRWTISGGNLRRKNKEKQNADFQLMLAGRKTYNIISLPSLA